MKSLLRYALAALMTVAGLMHFINEAFYLKMMPPFLPAHRELVWVSGVFEILGGIGLVPAFSRRFAAWGLVALYIAVFPANVYVAVQGIELFEGAGTAANWIRLPFQIVFIGWAVWIALKDRSADR